ncbi:MAG: VOC family protein [Planctomycetota bacterium]
MSDQRLCFHHIGMAVQDIASATRVLEDSLGCRSTGPPVDDPLQKATVSFLKSEHEGDPTIELVAPLGADSHLHDVLQRGGGAYHICYEVDDLEAKVAELKSKRWLVIQQPLPAAAFDGRRIAWLYAPTRALFELLESAVQEERVEK